MPCEPLPLIVADAGQLALAATRLGRQQHREVGERGDPPVDAGTGKAQGVCVVPALRDDGPDEGGEGVPRDVEPVRPGSPSTVIFDEGLTNVESHCLDYVVGLEVTSIRSALPVQS